MVARKHQLQRFVKRWGAVVLRRGLSAWVAAIRQLKQQQQAVAVSLERIRLQSLQSAFDRQASSPRLSSGLTNHALVLLSVPAHVLLDVLRTDQPCINNFLVPVHLLLGSSQD